MRVALRRSPMTRFALAASVTALFVTGLPATSASADTRPTDGFSLAAGQPQLVGAASADKASSSRLAQTPVALKNISSAKKIPVLIKYDYDALAGYKGTVSGYAATSPSVTDQPLRLGSPESARYLGHIRSQERGISEQVSAAVPATTITRSYRIVYGGVAALVPGNEVRRILRVPGVVAVQRDALRQPLTDSSSHFINADAAYAALHTESNAGQGVLLGNLDTGVWPEHPSFAGRADLPAYTGPALPCDFGDNPLTPESDPFVCTNKLVGGQSFLDTYDAFNSDTVYPGTARDAEGHGSHTASTSAGNVVEGVQTIGPELARINGIAPGAQIAEYRVCGPSGCYSSDTAAAVEQAILDGVKVINFSISGGTSPFTDPTELAFLDAYDAGVFVAASAGNEGPGAGTANHLSPWVTTVAASTQEREFASTLSLTAADGATFQVEGASITAGAGPLPIVLASDAPYSDAVCNHEADPGTFTGKIVVCRRGVNARVDKGYNVKQGGAAGMILFNPVQADVETDNHWLPAVHVADGTQMLAFINAHAGITGAFTAGAAKNGQGDVMAAFSSRGPAGQFIKPDITAPGVQILAAMTPTPGSVTDGPPGQYYQAIAGTSMSSPHIAGAALLVAAVHPGWTPGQIKSAMMTQSRTAVVKEDLTTPADAFDMGAGRIDVGLAIEAPVTISDTAADMAALAGDPLHAIDVNIPSINAPTMPGRVTTTRTLTNVTGRSLKVKPSADVPAGTTITFSPTSRTLRPGRSGSFRITLESTATTGSQQFATVYFRTNRGTAHLPVAFVPQQGSVSLTQSCDQAALVKGQTATCSVTATNNSFQAQDVTVTTTVNRNLDIVGRRPRASATLAGSQLGVPSMGPAGYAGSGYLDIRSLGVVPTPIGDEAIQNYDVPAFLYNGQPATRVGVDSNGYLVVGGGSAADNECCTLPAGASPNAPNNILAPFWTDLDGGGAPGISAAVLTDGTNSWLVVQWDVNVWGTSDTRAFQVWIGLNGVQDISYAYAAPQTDPGQPYLVGAENAAGAGDVQELLPADDIVISSTDPVPGDSLTYQVRVRGDKAGAGNVHSEMDANGVSGTTTVDTPITVTKR